MPFTPQNDIIRCSLHSKYIDLISEYRKINNDKADLVRGIFILDERTYNVLTTVDRADMWLTGDKAYSQNAHQLKSCASGSSVILGQLPESSQHFLAGNTIDAQAELETMADEFALLIKDIKSESRTIKSVIDH